MKKRFLLVFFAVSFMLLESIAFPGSVNVIFVPIGSGATPPSDYAWNPSDKASEITLSNGNVTASESEQDSSYHGVRALTAISHGKWYWEVQWDAVNANNYAFTGIGLSGWTLTDQLASDTNGFALRYGGGYKYHNNVGSSLSCQPTSITMIAFDADAGKIYYGKDNSWCSSADPANGTGWAHRYYYLTNESWYPAFSAATTTGTTTATILYGGSCNYSAPTGFTELGTAAETTAGGAAIAAGADDGMCYTAVGPFLYNTYDYLTIGHNYNYGFCIFSDVPVPNGATITSAKIVFTFESTTNTGTEANFRIYGVEQDDPAAPSNCSDITSWSKTTAYVDWDNVAESSTDQEIIETPDLATVVSEIVANGFWAAGERMGFYIENNGTTNNETRQFETFEEGTNGTQMAYLYVDWE